VRDGFGCAYGSVPPLALPVFFISFPRSGFVTTGVALVVTDGSVEFGAMFFVLFVESFI
jgi:hypothetical protein